MKQLQHMVGRHGLTKIWLIGVLFFLALLAVSRLLVSVYLGPNWDNAILIDGSYRVFLGQKPSHDFSTPIGPIYFAIGGLGMFLTSPTIAGMNLGLVLFGITLIGMCLYFFKDISKGCLGLFLLILGSYLFTGRMLHADNPMAGGYTGLYNLYGYCIFFIVTSWLFIFQSHSFIKLKGIEKSGGFFIAFLLILAIFIKNIFGVVLLVFLIFFRVNGDQKKFYQSLFLSAIALLFILLAWLNFDIEALIRDQIFVISSRLEADVWSYANALRFIKETWIDNVYILIAMLLSRGLQPEKYWVNLVMLGICYIFSAYLFCSSIMQNPVHVLSVFFAYVVIYQLSSSTKNLGVSAKLRKYMLISMSLALITHALYLNTWAVISNSKQLAKERPDFNAKSSRLAIQVLVNQQLKNIVNPNDRILSVGENDWFNFYFLTKSPINTPLYWHNSVTFNQRLLDHSSYFTPKNIFNDVTLVYLSTAFNAVAVDMFYQHYGEFLNLNYLLIYQDVAVKIYRKKV